MGGLLFILIAVAVFSAAIDAAGPGTLRVGTFNVRNSGAGDRPNAWPHRRSALIALVRDARPDVIGFQEVLADQQDDLAAALADYDSVATHRDDGDRRGEAAPVFFRRDRFDRIDAGTFWLSPDPDRPGPPAWDAACPRICTWVVLHDRPAGRRVALFNTHFDHVGETAKLESARLIVRRLSERPEPVVLLGDFNSTEDGPVYAALLAAARDAGRPLTDAHREVHPTPAPDEATYHGFTETTEGLRIDWILHDRNAVAVDSRIGPAKSVDGRYASDHSPLWADLRYGGTGVPLGSMKVTDDGRDARATLTGETAR